MHPLPLALLASCGGPPIDEPEPVDSTLQVTAYDPDVEPPSTELQLDEAAEAAQNTLDHLRVVTGAGTVSYYGALYEQRSQSCPSAAVGSDAWGDTEYWDGACRTPQGVWFNGPMTRWTFAEADMASGFATVFGYQFQDDDYAWTGVGMQGQTDIYDEAETFDFNCSCTAAMAIGVGEEHQIAYRSLINGPTHYDALEGGGGWWDEGILSETQTTFWVDTKKDEVELVASGTFSRMHERYDTVGFQVRARWGRRDDRCLLLSQGTLRVRDAATGVVFDGRLDSADDCTWCVTTGDLEGLCVDGRGVFDWDETPW